MGYTDLWKCKKCGTLPEIEMRGKNFVVKCTVCDTEKTTVSGSGLDEVVKLWNRQNEPPKPSLISRIKALFKKEDEEE